MIISPAKTLDYETPSSTTIHSIPDYLEKSAELIDVVKKKSSSDLMSLMQISQKIADLSVKRFNQCPVTRLPIVGVISVHDVKRGNPNTLNNRNFRSKTNSCHFSS